MKHLPAHLHAEEMAIQALEAEGMTRSDAQGVYDAGGRAKPTSVILATVLAAMDEAENISGPEGDEYVNLMSAIAAEANSRYQAHVESLLTQSV